MSSALGAENRRFDPCIADQLLAGTGMSPQYVASTQVPDARSGRQLHETEHTTEIALRQLAAGHGTGVEEVQPQLW